MIPENLDNTLFYYKYKVVAPARLAGSALVVQETLDQVLSIRKAWRFNRGERRVRRLPTLAYDSLQPDTNGMATADTVDVYNGAPDHYEWALLGKREMLVPYNSYAVHQKGLAYGDILKSRFINPDLLRYEPASRSAIPTPSAASTSTKTAGKSSPPTSTTRMAC